MGTHSRIRTHSFFNLDFILSSLVTLDKSLNIFRPKYQSHMIFVNNWFSKYVLSACVQGTVQMLGLSVFALNMFLVYGRNGPEIGKNNSV